MVRYGLHLVNSPSRRVPALHCTNVAFLSNACHPHYNALRRLFASALSQGPQGRPCSLCVAPAARGNARSAKRRPLRQRGECLIPPGRGNRCCCTAMKRVRARKHAIARRMGRMDAIAGARPVASSDGRERHLVIATADGGWLAPRAAAHVVYTFARLKRVLAGIGASTEIANPLLCVLASAIPLPVMTLPSGG